ncbi:MAG: M28 family peptidase [Planctomycetota bacterium]|nr:M28 family peptidase [Planctomycetota bacterium]
MPQAAFSRLGPVRVVLLAALAAAPYARAAETPRTDQPASADVAAALAAASPEEREFHQHVMTLANPFFEGRSADTRGNRLAAEYIEWHFRNLGLEPAFAQPPADPGAALVAETPYLQPFKVPGELEIRTAQASYSMGDQTFALELGSEFNPLGFSGKGQIDAPLVFVGYSIDDGPDGFASYKPGDDLTGKIAVMLRYEPADDKGESRWSNFSGWSRHAGLMEKMGAAVTRNAAGVILINPPAVKDPRARELEAPKATRFGKPIGVPAIMLSNDQARSLLKRAGSDDSLLQLRKLADEGRHGVVPLGQNPISFRMNIDVERASMATNNVGAILPGAGPIASELVVVGAHFDHVGYGYVGGANPSNQGKLHPGADDNASGTAGLILLAKLLKERAAAAPDAPRRGVLFLAFSAEEMGLLGAEHFVRASSIDPTRIVAMLNMDMIGRVRNNRVEVSGLGTAEEFPDILQPIFDRSGLDVNRIQTGMGPSDHAAFHRAGEPVLAFFSGLHPDYHTPTDEAFKVNSAGAVSIVRLVADITAALAERPAAGAGLTPKVTRGMTPGPAMGRGRARVRLGITPGDYSADQPGVLVGDVSQGGSADTAGIRKGDRIVRWGGEELADAGAMMQRLVDHKPGDIVEIEVVREGQPLTLRVTLQGRSGAE